MKSNKHQKRKNFNFEKDTNFQVGDISCSLFGCV